MAKKNIKHTSQSKTYITQRIVKIETVTTPTIQPKQLNRNSKTAENDPRKNFQIVTKDGDDE